MGRSKACDTPQERAPEGSLTSTPTGLKEPEETIGQELVYVYTIAVG